MLCAALVSGSGIKVTLFEKNEKLGKKLFITGKGRCNLTNTADLNGFQDNMVTNPKFLYSALVSFGSAETIRYFEEELKLRTKTERGGRVFPESDHACDVTDALRRGMKRGGTEICFNSQVKSLLLEGDRVKGIKLSGGKKFFADAVVISTGGLSYPSTGSTGDGYRFAREAGLNVTECVPSLVPFLVSGENPRRLQGLSLKNIGIKIYDGDKKLYEDFGELLFTHFGVSGPVILSASAKIPQKAFEKPLSLYIDLKPALDRKTLEERLKRDFSESAGKHFRNALSGLLPRTFIPVMVDESAIDADKPCGNITKQEREHLASLFKRFPFTITGKRGFDEAVITKGGVDVRELNPKTMEAKKVRGLYFIGEVIDVDALTGGFNLQIAWSSAHAAADAIIRTLKKTEE
ncbi:MAG: NAD(P)/FAD-dependent oxidoreductase [Lachnospiraceae bacterium]|nr:NAD(P)/FAD-dependent oxidoreductase [Lachnospiraceae bacterium]